MNLFLLGASPDEIARCHADVHVVKMILETAQMLYTAWWAADADRAKSASDPPAYRPTHRNHPVSRWIRAAPAHYLFAVEVGLALCREYTTRYEGRRHKTEVHLNRLLAWGAPPRAADPTPTTIAAKSDLKLATVGLPHGIHFYVCAIDDDAFGRCAVRDGDGRLDAIATYREYYRLKRTTLKRPMRWHGGERPGPSWILPEGEGEREVKRIKRAAATP